MPRSVVRPSLLFYAILAVTVVGGVLTTTLGFEDILNRPVTGTLGMFLLVIGTYVVYCTTYTWLSSTIPRPPAKRAASIGIANSLANLASFYGNYFWLDKYEPAFKQSWGIVLAFIALCLTCILALRFALTRMNRHFDELSVQVHNGEIQRHRLTVEEVSALDNGFRYVI